MTCRCGSRAVTSVPEPRCRPCAEAFFAGLLVYARIQRLTTEADERKDKVA